VVIVEQKLARVPRPFNLKSCIRASEILVAKLTRLKNIEFLEIKYYNQVAREEPLIMRELHFTIVPVCTTYIVKCKN